MRPVLLLAATAVLLTACSSGNTAAPITPPTTAAPASTPTTASSPAAPKVLTWGATGTSTQVDITLGTPVLDTAHQAQAGKRYVLIPVKVTNHNPGGTATISFSGRVGQVEAAPMNIGAEPTPKFLPDESGEFQRRFEVPAAGGELIVETYANINQAPTQNRLTFKGPLPA